jgi:hypothetical protein
VKYGKTVGVRGSKKNRFGGKGVQGLLEGLESRLLMSTVTVSPVLVAEGNSNTTATLTARLDAASRSNIVLLYSTQDATATSGVNYARKNSMVVIPAGATSATFSIPILASHTYQGLTSFGVNLAASPGTRLGQARTTVYIADKEAAPKVAIGDVNVPAGSGVQVVNVPVTLSSRTSRPVTVAYVTMNDRAVAGRDYQSTAGKVTIMPGQTTAMIPVVVLAGSSGDKAFDVVLAPPTNASLMSQWEYGRVAIHRGAAVIKPTVTVSNASAMAGEFEQFHVSLSAATPRRSTPRVAERSLTAATISDRSPISFSA